MKISIIQRLMFRQRTLACVLMLLGFSLILPIKVFTALPEQDFIIYTPPKCGTHLVCNVVGYMLGSAPLITDELGSVEDAFMLAQRAKNNNQFLVSHSFTMEMLENFIAQNYKVLFIIRDPRDQLISMMYWMKKGYWNQFTVSKIKDIDAQIDELITGEIYGWRCYEGCIGIRLACVEKLPKESVYITRFESLVGTKGRGLQDVQNREIVKLADFLDIGLSCDQAQDIADHSFGGTWSFREGKIGSWKEHFLPHQIAAYKTLYGNLLIELEYESHLDW